MLMANLVKSPSLERLTDLERASVPSLSTSSNRAVTQLIEVYNLGSRWNKDADYDYLGYVLADLVKVKPTYPFTSASTASNDLLTEAP